MFGAPSRQYLALRSKDIARAGRQSAYFIEIAMIERIVNRLPRRCNVRVINQPSQMWIRSASTDNPHMIFVTVKSFTLMTIGNIGQGMRRVKDKIFEHFAK